MDRLIPAVMLLLLAGCDRASDTRTVSVSRDDAGAGAVEVRLPGFEMKTDRLGGLLAESDFELDGVRLYPGSRTTGIKVDAVDGRDKKATVRIDFSAPAAPATVRNWFVAEFAKAKRPVTARGDIVSGATEDGDPFRIELTATGTGSRGTVIIDG